MAKRKTPIYPKVQIVSFLSDYGFKVTFGDKDNTLFARKALEIILEEEPIEELTYLRNEFEGISPDARAGLYDVVCQDEHKRIFIVEMQVDNYSGLLERLQFYAFHIFNNSVRKGMEGFKSLAAIHCICIIKDSVTESTNYHQVITLKNEDNEIVMDNIIFHLIELGKFPIAKKQVNKAISSKEQLFYTMKYAHKFDPKDKENTPPFWEQEFYQIALKRLDLSRMSPMDIALYESSLLREHVVADKRKQDIQKAVELAMLEKDKEAAQKLLEKDKEAAQKLLESVKNLIKMGIPTEKIAIALGVSLEYVTSVQKELN